MTGLPFIELHRHAIRRIYVIHDPTKPDEVDIESITGHLVAGGGYATSVLPVGISREGGMGQLFAARDSFKRTPPEILRRTIIGIGSSAITALQMSFLTSVDEVFAFAPEQDALTARGFDLALFGRDGPAGRTQRNVFSRFETPELRKLLASLAPWCGCIVTGEKFVPESRNAEFSAMLEQIGGRYPVTLPNGCLRISMEAA